jgi:hypothetical protein
MTKNLQNKIKIQFIPSNLEESMDAEFRNEREKVEEKLQAVLDQHAIKVEEIIIQVTKLEENHAGQPYQCKISLVSKAKIEGGDYSHTTSGSEYIPTIRAEINHFITFIRDKKERLQDKHS